MGGNFSLSHTQENTTSPQVVLGEHCQRDTSGPTLTFPKLGRKGWGISCGP